MQQPVPMMGRTAPTTPSSEVRAWSNDPLKGQALFFLAAMAQWIVLACRRKDPGFNYGQEHMPGVADSIPSRGHARGS